MSDASTDLQAAEEAGLKRDAASLGAVLDLVGKVLGFASVIAALLFYFGWARTDALYGFFGVDQSMLGFSTQDYLLRSVTAMWKLLRWVIVIALAALWGDFWLKRWLEKRGQERRRLIVQRSIAAVGAVLVAASLVATAVPVFWRLVGPMFYSLTWTAGICLAAYAFYLHSGADPAKSSSERAKDPYAARTRDLSRVSLWLFVGLLLVSMFWVVSVFANVEGTSKAQQIGTFMDWQHDVVVYSAKNLNLQGPGISMSEVCPAGGECEYQYTGLKFLVRSGGKYFLFPAGWTAANAVTIVLPDNESIRVEVAPGPTPDLTP